LGLTEAIWEGKEDHGPPKLDPELESAEDIDEGFTGRAYLFVLCLPPLPLNSFFLAENPNEVITAELRALYSSFQRCLDLRDKYMSLSRQRLEDNPANYDGTFSPSASPSYASTSHLNPVRLPEDFEKWNIYPPPPDPHWKERDPYAVDSAETTEEIAAKEAKRRKFEWEKAQVPAQEKQGKRRRFALDANGVYQVYDEGAFPPSRFLTSRDELV
jgi:AMP deaminase